MSLPRHRSQSLAPIAERQVMIVTPFAECHGKVCQICVKHLQLPIAFGRFRFDVLSCSCRCDCSLVFCPCSAMVDCTGRQRLAIKSSTPKRNVKKLQTFSGGPGFFKKPARLRDSQQSFLNSFVTVSFRPSYDRRATSVLRLSISYFRRA